VRSALLPQLSPELLLRGGKRRDDTNESDAEIGLRLGRRRNGALRGGLAGNALKNRCHMKIRPNPIPYTAIRSGNCRWLRAPATRSICPTKRPLAPSGLLALSPPKGCPPDGRAGRSTGSCPLRWLPASTPPYRPACADDLRSLHLGMTSRRVSRPRTPHRELQRPPARRAAERDLFVTLAHARYLQGAMAKARSGATSLTRPSRARSASSTTN
jgi:hypothetical protein